MRIVVTGAFGYLGELVSAALLDRGTCAGNVIDDLVLADRVTRDLPLCGDPRVSVVPGDLLDTIGDLFLTDDVDVVVHLASAVSAECEADFDLGMRANLETTRALLEAARAQQRDTGKPLRFVFASSVAVYGADEALALPDVVDEATLPMPQSSYGTQKYACEQLIADYTRRGFVDGRVARLMTVVVRAGTPNAAASGFLSSIIREPLAGQRATCQVGLDVEVALASPGRTVDGLLTLIDVARHVPEVTTDLDAAVVAPLLPEEQGHESGAPRLVGRLPVNFPALTVTVGEMLETLRRVCGDEVADRVTLEPDPAIERIVGSWPARFDTRRAAGLGLEPDGSFEEVLRQYLEVTGTPQGEA